MIDTDEKLAVFLEPLRQAEWIALDTEADSLHSYPEKLCLIQVSIAGADRIIDPLAGMDLSPLWEELSKRELIFHAADYDLRLLRRDCRFVPARIFDTMLAARLLGERSFGLQHLVSQFIGVHLEKGPQKADWARRPLTERMENYARNDTRHLKPLADILRSRLAEKGRLSWHEEYCARLVAECAVTPPEDPEPWRLQGCSRLSRPALAVLQCLWQWREQEALAFKRPPFFILSREAMLDIAEAAASGLQWKQLIPKHFSPRRRAGSEAAVEQGLAVPADLQPSIRHHYCPRPSRAEQRRMEELTARRDHAAHQLHLDPAFVASRPLLRSLAHDWEAHAPELMAWQREILTARLPRKAIVSSQQTLPLTDNGDIRKQSNQHNIHEDKKLQD